MLRTAVAPPKKTKAALDRNLRRLAWGIGAILTLNIRCGLFWFEGTRLWPRTRVLRQSAVVILDHALVLRQELFAERALQLLANLVGQVTPKAAEHLFHVSRFDRFLCPLFDAIGAVPRRAGRGIAARASALATLPAAGFVAGGALLASLLDQFGQVGFDLLLDGLGSSRGVAAGDSPLGVAHALAD